MYNITTVQSGWRDLHDWGIIGGNWIPIPQLSGRCTLNRCYRGCHYGHKNKFQINGAVNTTKLSVLYQSTDTERKSWPLFVCFLYQSAQYRHILCRRFGSSEGPWIRLLELSDGHETSFRGTSTATVVSHRQPSVLPTPTTCLHCRDVGKEMSKFNLFLYCIVSLFREPRVNLVRPALLVLLA